MQLPKFDIRVIAIIIFFSTLFFPHLVISQKLNITTDKEFYSINETALISINGAPNTNFTLVILYPDNTSTILTDFLNYEGEYNHGLGLTEYGNYSAKLNSTNFTKSIMFFVLSSEEDQGISIPQPGPSEIEFNSTGETNTSENQTTTTIESNFTEETNQTQEFNETINTTTSTTIVTTTTEKVISTEIQTTITTTQKLTTSSVTTTQTIEQEPTTTSEVTTTQATKEELTTTTKSTSTTTTTEKYLEAQTAPEINDEVKDNENKTVGKKIQDEPDYETYILLAEKDEDHFVLVFYHDSEIELPIWAEGDVNYTLSQNVSSANENVTLVVDLVEGQIPYFKLHVGQESEVFEFGIRILNVQSYPLVGGEWKVEFETWGEGRLKIENLNYSAVTFNSLYQDSVLVDVDIDENNTIESDWSYSNGKAVYDVHKKGRHILKFTFGNVEYAYNLAGDTWWNHSWRYRTEIRVNNSFNRTNGLVTYGMNFTDIIINELGYSGKIFDNNSVRVVEWNSTEGTNTELPSVFQNISTYDNQTNANGTVYWVMDNITAPGVNKTFYIYFDTADGGTKQAPNYTDTMHAKLKLLTAEEYVTLSGSDCMLYYIHSYKNGTFASQQLIEDHSASNCWGMGIGDFDNDGDYDVVMGAGNGNVYYYEHNEDDGDFSDSGTNVGSFIEASSYGMDIATSDFNNDGNLDFVISGNSDGYTLFTGYGNGSFTTNTITTDGPGTRGRGKDDGDFNEDGCMDFISGTDELNFYFWEGNCDGTFETPVVAGSLPSGYDHQYGIVSGDLDEDGHYDLWVDGRNTGVWWFVKGDGDGTFQEESQLADFADYWNPGDAFDYDHDGDLDLVRTDYNNRYGYYHEGYGNSSFKTSGFTTIATQADTNRMGITAPTKHYEYPLNISRSSAEVGASINILDESNYPSLQVYTKGNTIQIRVNETEGQSETADVNITLTFSDSSTKTYEMINGTAGSVDLWEYNYTVLSSDITGQLNLTATAYDNSALELTTNEVTGLYIISTLTIVNSSGYATFTSYSFSSGNVEENITFSGAGYNNSVRLKVPTEADVSYSVLNLTGSSATGGSDWWDTNWGYRKSLTFDNTDQNENLENFTVLVKLNSSNFDYSRVSSRDELRFIDNDNSTVLNHHVEFWDESGDSFIWVKVPQIDSLSSTDYIWLYYGNSEASNNENESGTYDSNYVMVYHMNETAGTSYDSTGNTDLSEQGAVIQDVDGQIDGGDEFDNNAANYLSGSSSAFDGSEDPFTIYAWVKKDGNGDYDYIFAMADSTGNWGTNLAVLQTSRALYTYPDTLIQFDCSIPDDSKMHQVALTYAGGATSSSTLKAYIDDTLCSISSGSSSGIDTDSSVVRAGYATGNNHPLDGVIDEVRISNTNRSADWINASYLSTTDQFITFGSEEEGQYPTNVTLDVGTQDQSYEWNQTGELTTTNTTSDLSSSINSYLPICENDGDGFCDQNIQLNVSSTSAGKVSLDNLDLRYETNESSVFSVIDWWMNDTDLIASSLIDKATYYKNTSTKPSVDLAITGFKIDNSSTSCEIDDSTKTVLYQNGNAYCPLDNTKTIDHTSGGTWGNYRVGSSVLANGYPVKKTVETTELDNIALSTNGGTILSASSEMTNYEKENAIDGTVGDAAGESWKSNSADFNPWIKIQFNDTYYITHIKWANRVGKAIENLTLHFSDGYNRTITLQNNGDLNQYNLSEKVWTSWINFSTDTTYHGAGYAGAQEIEVYGTKGDQVTETGNIVKKFNITGYLPNGTISPDTGDYKFYNITTGVDAYDTLFTAGTEALKWYNGSDWVELNITNQCANLISETETNYGSKTIGSDDWYSCYNDTDGDGVKDYFKILIPHLSNQQFKVSALSNNAAINILDEDNYPQVKTYKKGDIINIRVNETSNQDYMNLVNITLTFSDSSTKTYEMINGTAGSVDLWEYNYTVQLGDSPGNLSLTARGYSSNNIQLTDNSLSGIYISDTLHTMNSTGFVISSTDMFSTNNVIEDINFSSPTSNQTIRLRLPKNAVVTSCYLNITGMDNTGGGGGEENTWTQTSKGDFDLGNKTNVTTTGDVLHPVESGYVELTNNVIFAEDFSGSTINETRFDYGGGTVTQDENVTLHNNNNDWDNYLNTDDNWAIVADRTFQARVTATSGTRMMIGWKDTSAGVSYSDMPYAIYFRNGGFRIYEDGNNRGDVGSGYTQGAPHDIKIVLKATGATYYYKEVSSSSWTQLYDSSHDSGQSNLKPHIVHYDTTSGRDSITDNWQIYDGSNFEYNTEGLLESKSFKANMTANWVNVTWGENITDGTNITFQVSTSNDNSSWSPWSDVFVNNNSELIGVSDSLYVKWRANLTTTNTSNTPNLGEVNISYTMGQFPSNVSLNINGGEEEWNQTGKFKITNKTSDLSSSINSYLSSCVQDSNGFCDGDVPINITVQDSGIVRLDNLTLKYETDESSNILGKDWWMNDTDFVSDTVIDKATYYSNISTPSFDLELAGFLINNSSTSCEIDDSSKTILYQNGNAYCPLVTVETFDKSGNGTWTNHSVNTNILSDGKPVKKIVELTETTNMALSNNGGTVVSASSELYSKENAIDGVVGNDTDDAWSSISTDTNPWIKIQFNNTYYISHIKWANMPTNSIENMTLYFNDGSSQNLTLEDNTDLNRYNLSENVWASSINFSVDTTYEGGGYAGAQEIEVYGEKGDQHTSGLVEYKLFNITGYFPNGTVSPDTGDYKFYNITAEIDVSDGNFISKAEKLRWYNGSDWVDLNITNKCANPISEIETNYSSKTIGSDVWYSCYNDTDANSLKDYFKILVPHLSNQQFKIESNDTENPVVVNTGIDPTTLNVNNNITIEANVTDNADISRVWAVITKPNSDEENVTLTHVSGDTYDKVYRINITGTYDISVYTNDTFNNINSTSAGTVISNFVIDQPQTYNKSIYEKTTFEVGDTVVIRVNVTDPEQAYDSDKVLINLTNPEPEIKIQNTEMSLQSTTGDQKTYEYNFTTMENLTLSLGAWAINISANDTGGNSGINSTTFTIQDTTKPQIISKSVSLSSIIVNNNVTLEANITDNTNISSVWILVTKPNSDEENVTLTHVSGDTYNTSYKLPMTGTYNATIYVNDTSNNLNSSWIDTFDSNLLVKIPKTYNTSIDEVTTFELGDDVIVRVNVTKPDEEYIIDSVLINMTNNQSVNKIENVNMTYLSNISDQWLYETNLTSMLYETASVGTWNITVFVNDTNQQLDTNTTTFLVEDTKPPVFDNESITPSDLGMNDNVTIQVDAVDIISQVWVNITKPDGGPENISLDLVSGNTYQATYNASESGLYNVTAFANDTSNQVNNTWMGTFRTYGNTTGLILEQPQYFILSNVTQDYSFTFRLNLTLRNTGNATATNAKIDTEILSGWIRDPDESQECGSISAGETCTKYYNITVPTAITDNNYTINGTGKWKNLDDTKSFIRNNTVVNVTRNPILNITNNSFTTSIQHGTSEDLGYFDINSTGNYKIGGLEINKTGGNLTDSWVGFSETSINSVSAGENKSITINTTVPMGYDQGLYEGEYLVNATTSTCSPLDSCWKYLNITVTVPENTTWSLNPENITEDVYVNTSGPLTNLTITNIGNIQMKFNITEDDSNTSTILDISNINETITLEDQTLSNYSHNITSNYTIPVSKQPGGYNTIVSITNSSLNPTQRNVTIILNVIDNILPTIENTSLNDTLLDVNYQSLNITADVTDNIDISRVWTQIIFPNETDQNITMGPYIGNTYSVNYTPTVGGIHNITIFANDTSNNIQSSWLDEFEAVSTTTGPMYQLPTYLDAEINTQISVNLTLNNTGNATMYDANLKIILEQYGFVADDTETYNCGNIEPNSSCNYNFTVNITDEAAAFTHWIYGNGTWKNPNNTLNNIQNETELYIQLPPASLNILENTITNSIDEGVTGEAGNFTIRASGNNLNGITINVSDDGNISSNWVTFSPRSYIPLLLAETNEVIDVNVSVPTGQDGGNYQTNITANATGSVCSPSSNCWDNILLNITVPTDYSWNRTPDIYNLTVLKGTYDNFVIRLVNQGNVNMSLKVRATVYPDCTNHTPDSDCTYLSTYTEEVDIGKQEEFNDTFYYSTPYIGNTTMDIKIYRADDSSDVKHTWIYMNVIEPPPTIENVTASPTVLDINHGTVNISAYVSDNIQVDKVWVNITNNVSESFPMNLRSGDVYSGGWWEKIYTPSSSGTHIIVVYANDTTNSVNESSEHSFNVIANTSLLIDKSPTSKTVHGVTQTTNKSFELNLTLDNAGLGGAYSPNISFDLPSALVAEPSILYFNNISSGTSISNATNITVINGTSLGYYEVGIYSNWTNPDNTLGQNSTTLGVTVESSPVIEIKNSSLSLELDDGQSTSRNIILESTGNSPANDIQVNCTGAKCSAFNVTLDPNTVGSLTPPNTREINLSLSIPRGTVATTYFMNIISNITGSPSGISDEMPFIVTVPENKTWSVSPSSFSTTVGLGISGAIGILTLENSGNTLLNFNLTVNGNISDYVSLDSSTLSLEASNSETINLEYNSSELGNYLGNITIDSTGTTPQRNVSVNLTVISFGVDVLNPTSSNITTLTPGDTLEIHVNASEHGELINQGVSWDADVQENTCAVTSSSFDYTNNYWIVNCTTPTGIDSGLKDLRVYGTYDLVTVSDLEMGSVNYTDVNPPSFVSITANPVNRTQEATIIANITDDIRVDTVLLEVEYLNSTKINTTMNNVSNLWTSTITGTSLVGDYDFIIYANDTSDNYNTDSGWFEVRSNTTYKFNGTISDPAGTVWGTDFVFKRPDTNSQILNFSTNATSGYYEKEVHPRTYNIEINTSNSTIELRDVNINQNNLDSLNTYGFDTDSVTLNPSAYTPYAGIFFDTNISFENATLTFNYPSSVSSESLIGIYKCVDWSFDVNGTPTCSDYSWTRLNDTDVDSGNNQASLNLTNFSAYIASKFVCGNGECESNYGESNSVCSSDCPTSNVTGTTGTGTGITGGGGGGGLSEEELEEALEKIEPSPIQPSTDLIEITLHPGEHQIASIGVTNNQDTNTTVQLSAEGSIWDFIEFEDETIELEKKSTKYTKVKFSTLENTIIGVYTGNILMTDEKNRTQKVGVILKVELERESLLDVKVESITKTVSPGNVLRFKVDVYNLGQTKRVDITNTYSIRDAETDELFSKKQETFAVETTVSYVKTMEIPEELPLGKYVIEAVSLYDNKTASSIDTFEVVKQPLVFRILYSIASSWITYVILFIIIPGAYFGNKFYKKWKEKKEKERKYIFPVDFKKLPKAGERSILVGKVAETNVNAYINMDKLQVHMLAAGATGSGKSVSSQIIAEELLKRGLPVIVFDPTFQWSGFARQSKDKRMLSLYSKFGMKPTDARSFKTNIIIVDNPEMKLDIQEHIKPGEITVFGLHKLNSSELDKFVRNTIDSFFEVDWPASQKLKLLVVFDEVHRLLPKYGGKGGYVSLEKGAREFRKWGIGLIMISQVLLDFRAAIRTNVGTEALLRTKYSGDINRVRKEYGEEYSKTLPKLTIGTALVHNPEYNDGKPYFISFRPLLHQTSEISDQEMEQIINSEKRLEEIEAKISELRERKVDTYDMEVEVKLAKEKMKEGQMRMAGLYLESVENKIKTIEEKS